MFYDETLLSTINKQTSDVWTERHIHVVNRVLFRDEFIWLVIANTYWMADDIAI